MNEEPETERGAALEAKIAFMERELDHMRAQLGDVWKEFAALTKRMSKLERRIDAASENLES